MITLKLIRIILFLTLWVITTELCAQEDKANLLCQKWEFVESLDPRGETYYWLTGTFTVGSQDPETDIWALKNGYISVVPSGHDLTHYASIKSIKSIEDL